MWVGFDANFYRGGAVKLDGEYTSAPTLRNSRFGATFSLPINRRHSIKFIFSNGVFTRLGTDFTQLAISYQFIWLGLWWKVARKEPNVTNLTDFLLVFTRIRTAHGALRSWSKEYPSNRGTDPGIVLRSLPRGTAVIVIIKCYLPGQVVAELWRTGKGPVFHHAFQSTHQCVWQASRFVQAELRFDHFAGVLSAWKQLQLLQPAVFGSLDALTYKPASTFSKFPEQYDDTLASQVHPPVSLEALAI